MVIGCGARIGGIHAPSTRCGENGICSKCWWLREAAKVISDVIVKYELIIPDPAYDEMVNNLEIMSRGGHVA